MMAAGRMVKAGEVLGAESLRRALKARRALAAKKLGFALSAGESMVRRWYVIRVRPNKSVDAELSRMGVTCWQPTEVKAQRVQGTARTREVSRPAWPGYLLVRMPEEQLAWDAVMGVDGVIGVLSTARGRCVLSDEYVNTAIRLWAVGAFDSTNDARAFQPGQRVMVLAGPLAHQVVEVDAPCGKRALRVLTSLLGRMLPVTIDVANVEKL